MSLGAEANDLKAILSGTTQVPVLDLEEIRALGTPPVNYVEIHLAPLFGGQSRLDGSREAPTLRRLSTRVACSTISNAQLVEQRITDAFNLTTVVVDGEPRQVLYESGGGDYDYDDGWYTALTAWTF